ncbi:protein shuttle craft-like [Ischnura elegans]|uniref:protein shuttle craft-like n=1 Tax=Ischnura elegans TaxID=197161 RepID=UPI001ED8BC2D|nr:protein shuttle craft-like [Ischnura elegans]XP_046396085.1 protein shuttle craft-like [Ischnura elegans]
MENWNNPYYYGGDPMDFFGMYGHQQQETLPCGPLPVYSQLPMMSALPLASTIQPTPLEFVERNLISQSLPPPPLPHDNSGGLYIPHNGGIDSNMMDQFNSMAYVSVPSIPSEPPPPSDMVEPPDLTHYDHSMSNSVRGGRSNNFSRVRTGHRSGSGRIFSGRGNHAVRPAPFTCVDHEDGSRTNGSEHSGASERQTFYYDNRGFRGSGRKRSGGNSWSRGPRGGSSRGTTSSRNNTPPMSYNVDNTTGGEDRNRERRQVVDEAHGSASAPQQSENWNKQRRQGNFPKENFRNPSESTRNRQENRRNNRYENARKPMVNGGEKAESEPNPVDGEKKNVENTAESSDGGRMWADNRRNFGENSRISNDYGRNQREGRRNHNDGSWNKAESWRGSNRDWRSVGDGPRHYESGRQGYASNDRKNQAESWRYRKERSEDESKDRRKNLQTESFGKGTEETSSKGKETEASRREKLEDGLRRGNYECMVCCEHVRQRDSIWSCGNCFHVFHLRCIKQWARTSRDDGGWRCPACQTVRESMPYDYYCFCGKVKDPEWNRRDTPHSCGEVCGKGHEKPAHCTHTCILLCHPGPCPPCSVMASRNCECGKTSQVLICGRSQALLCGDVCGKLLNCGLHNCSALCHEGPCADCEVMVKQVCHCGKNERSVLCVASTAGIEFYECGSKCERLLDCKNHKCEVLCHPSECSPCALMPKRVTRCPCGKVALGDIEGAVERQSCLDPVPTCGKTCEKVMDCGQPGKNHICKELCHEGPCPPCTLTTLVKCRCGNMNKEIPCSELTTKADDARCNKKCTKKRSCWRHKCLQLCCIDLDHVCPLICNHNLSCGLHKCEEPCHRGNCPPCWRASFEELHCECGASVMFPPIPCGARPPECQNICSRPHPCTHVPNHTCHSLPECPPCTALTERYCHGNHELRKNVPCHQTEISCGRPCGKDLPCGRHKCILLCHKGSCTSVPSSSTQQSTGSAPWVCKQPCTTPRSLCGHPCGVACHDGPCPDSPCREMVKVTCECGHRSTTRACSENATEYQQMAVAMLASKMVDMQMGHSVDLRDLAGSASSRKESLKTLECNDECKLIERNRRLALCLQIRNPDLTGKIIPRYSESMKQWGKKDPAFVQMVHDRLTELVQLAKQSKQKSRSYMFKVMGLPKRQLVHEYCEHFGCEAQSYDEEPNRNVVATALRDKSWLPSLSLLEVLKREAGSRKPPVPIQSSRPSSLASASKTSLNTPSFSTLCSSGASASSIRIEKEKTVVAPGESNATSSSTGASAASSTTSQTSGNKDSSATVTKPPVIDYFDYTGD